jgi:Zn-dependent protease
MLHKTLEFAVLAVQLVLVGWVTVYMVGGDGLTLLAVTAGAFGSVMLHEWGHYQAAKGHGAKGLRIGFGWFGAYTAYEQPNSRKSALDIASRGAVYNIGMAIELFVFLMLSPGSWWAPALIGVAYFNLGLVLINLIPTLPSDGGHIILALTKGNLTRTVHIVNAIDIGILAGGLVTTLLWMPAGGGFLMLIGASALLATRKTYLNILTTGETTLAIDTSLSQSQ